MLLKFYKKLIDRESIEREISHKLQKYSTVLYDDTEKYLISFRDLLKFGFSFFLVIWVLVRMPFHGELAISFLKIIICSSFWNLENAVVIHSHNSKL